MLNPKSHAHEETYLIFRKKPGDTPISPGNDCS